MTALPLEWWLIYGLLVLIAFTVASTLGIGGPLIILPALLFHFEAAEAVSLLVPTLFLNNLARAGLYRKQLSRKAVFRTGLLAIPLSLAASFFTGDVHPSVLKGIIVLIIVFVLVSQYLFRKEFRVGPKGLMVWGLPIGLLSGLSGTPGSAMAIAFRGFGLSLAHFVGTVALLQVLLQLSRVPGYVSSGLLNESNYLFAIFLALMSLPGVWLGKFIMKRISPGNFRVALDILLGIIAAFLIYNIVLLECRLA